MQDERRGAKFRPKEKRHIRGAFPALDVGVTYGNGLRAPVNLHTGHHTAMLERLLNHPGLHRMAAFADGRTIFTILLAYPDIRLSYLPILGT